MSVPTIIAPVGVEEYLSNPAYEHCEYIDGQVVELNVGTISHGRIQVKCGRKLDEYFDAHPAGYAGTEIHCRLKIGGKIVFRLPDVAAVLGEVTDGRYLDRAPDLVVEIRSPDDRLPAQFRKMDEYFENGARLGWLILPEEKSAFVFTPNAPVRTVIFGELLTGGDVLPGLEIPLESLLSRP
ncbi:MAG: Uma2 family endonuclease [Pseudomonadota bacterium]